MIERVDLTGWARNDAEQAIEAKLNEIIDALNVLASPRHRETWIKNLKDRGILTPEQAARALNQNQT